MTIYNPFLQTAGPPQSFVSKAHKSFVRRIVPLVDGTIVTCSEDNSAKRWQLIFDGTNVTTIQLLNTYEGHTFYVTGVVEIDINTIVTGSYDRTMKFWNKHTAQCLKTIQAGDAIHSMILMGDYIVCGMRYGSIDFFLKSIDAEASVGYVKPGHVPINAICVFEFDIASRQGSDEDKVKRNQNGDQISNGEATATTFGSKKMLVSGSERKLSVWNVETRQRVQVIGSGHHTGEITRVISLEHRNRLASASEDKTIRIWDVLTGVCLWTLEGHHHGVRAIARLSCELIVSGSLDETLRVWNVESGKCVSVADTYNAILSITTLRNDDENKLMVAVGGVEEIQIRDPIHRAKLVDMCCWFIRYNPALFDMELVKTALAPELVQNILRYPPLQ
eukprot:TRINITY_DN2878_c0_g1_i1.p1 TRINITY_DN2878_c0_g1~~TRINITY_DN2878_c0_g1_i1.p1  ORF type:complete len:390 (-),score=76.56 TRINITY_DN2878_c0_g1_i1:235-1404(-)